MSPANEIASKVASIQPLLTQNEAIDAEKGSAVTSALLPPIPSAIDIKRGSVVIVDADVSPSEQDDGMDGSYSWVVLVCGVFLQFMSVGITLSAGVLVVEFREVFNADPALASLLSSLNCGIAFGASPLGGIVCNRFSHRISLMAGSLITAIAMVGSAYSTSIYMLLLIYGMVGGLGLALVYSPSISAVGLYFRRHRPLALGITVAGGAAGPLALPPILRWLIELYSWRGAFVMMGGLMMQCCVFAALFVPVKHLRLKPTISTPPKIERQNSSWQEITNYSILLNPSFILQFMNNLMWCMGISPLWMLLPDYASECGMTRDQGAFLISLLSLGNVLGRLVAALLMNFCPNLNRLNFHSLSPIIGGLFFALFSLKEVFALFALTSFCVGFSYGTLVGSLPVVTSDLYGINKLTSAFSYIMLADGLGFAAGPPLAGWMFGFSRSYMVPVIISGVIYSLSGFVMFFTRCTQKCEAPDDSDVILNTRIPLEKDTLASF